MPGFCFLGPKITRAPAGHRCRDQTGRRQYFATEMNVTKTATFVSGVSASKARMARKNQ
jgi:hypothetical protein